LVLAVCLPHARGGVSDDCGSGAGSTLSSPRLIWI